MGVFVYYIEGYFGIYIVIIVLLGGWVGAYTGSKKLNEKNMKYMLAVVLIMASIKLLFV